MLLSSKPNISLWSADNLIHKIKPDKTMYSITWLGGKHSKLNEGFSGLIKLLFPYKIILKKSLRPSYRSPLCIPMLIDFILTLLMPPL